MSKINCRVCDICGESLGARDVQWWLKIPYRTRLYYGAPGVGMIRQDVCDDCMTKLVVDILMRRKNEEAKA